VRRALADDLEEFVRDGVLWDADQCGELVDRLAAESAATDDPLPERVGRFLQAVQLRTRVSTVTPALRVEIEAIVYPRLWKLIEAIRDDLPEGELRTRIEVMNRRLARLFVEETE
jgi:hypothetical protein